MKFFVRYALALLAFAPSLQAFQGAPNCSFDSVSDYVFVPLSGLGDRPFTATALNDAGQVAGRVTLDEDHQAAFVWQGGSVLLESFTDAIVTVEDLTEAGVVLGTVRGSGQSVADTFVWDSSTGDLLIVPTPVPVFPQGLNDAFELVGVDAESLFGFSLTVGTGQFDVIAFGDLPMTSVGTPGARAINAAGVAVGSEVVETLGGTYFERPYRWTLEGGIEMLALVPGGLAGRAVDVSSSGDIAGTVFDEFFAFEPALWKAGTLGVTGLGWPFGFGSGDALALNDHEQVLVVSSNDIFGFTRGFLWDAGAYVDLSCFAPQDQFVTRALDINDSGDILVQLTDDVGLQVVDIGVLQSRAGVPSEEVVRLGTPPNPGAFQVGVTSGPVVGAIWDPVIDHTAFVPGATLDVAILALAPANTVLPGNGTLLCDVGSWIASATASAPGEPFLVPIPANPGLVGLAFCAQGASADAAGFHLANAIDATIGDV